MYLVNMMLNYFCDPQAETILNGWHNSFANIEEDEIPKVQAQKFIQDFETTISAGLCRGTTLSKSTLLQCFYCRMLILGSYQLMRFASDL